MNPQLLSELEAALAVYRQEFGDPALVTTPTNGCSPLCKDTCENQCTNTCISTVGRNKGDKCNVGGYSRVKTVAISR